MDDIHNTDLTKKEKKKLFIWDAKKKAFCGSTHDQQLIKVSASSGLKVS